MITVRFPSGVSVQYNSANYVARDSGGRFVQLYHRTEADVLAAKNGGWIAQVPNEAIIEVSPACRVYRATASDDAHTQEVRALRKSVDRMRKRVSK